MRPEFTHRVRVPPGSGDEVGGREAHLYKVLNNNVVISVDERGRERVLMGRGVGFQLKATGIIDANQVEKTFVLDQASDQEHAVRVLAYAPYPIVEAVGAAVDGAERQLGRDLGRRLLIAVIDHIQYVLERLDNGIRIPTANLPQLRVLHPQEFAAATQMSETISSKLDRILPSEEAAFLTMHLLSATRNEPNGTAAQLFRRVQHVVTTVETGLGVTLDVDSPGYARFILHVQFLLQRLVSESMLRSSDNSFFEFARMKYPDSYRIAEEVKRYVSAATGSDLTDEELLYLIVHVERLAGEVRSDTSGGAVLP